VRQQISGPDLTSVSEQDEPVAPEAFASVWVVDDSPMQREMLRQALASRYAVTSFAGGASVLEALAAASSPPHLVVLDWYMPDMSGIDVCRFVRETLDLAQLPILLLTAGGTGESLVEALAAGANDFVRKPVPELELVARVATLVRMASQHRELTIAEQKLRVEADFRERFMGMLAHDLRQPLNTVVMAARNLLLLDGLTEKLHVIIAMQLRAAERMTRMIGELLDFTRNRPESGISIQREWADLAAIARASVDEIEAAHPEHPLSLSVDGPCLGYWDRDRLTQICSNLIGNAIEHSAPQSPVNVHVAGTRSDVELRVSNQGQAIPDDVLATLFQPFRRGRDSKRSTRGVGLGLHIVHQIVTAHGGTISVRSADQETQFVVHLPRGAGAPQALT
jgi:signal transduction histidine kinase